MRRRFSSHRGRDPIIAAIDLGTNSCRLLVLRVGRDEPRIIDSYARIVRLGEGVKKSGLLSDAAKERTLNALKICAQKLAFHKVANFRAVATEACRLAANAQDLIDQAHAIGIPLEVIPQQEEARLALRGCASALNPDIPYAITFDIGGGSTELMWLRVGRGRKIAQSEPEILDIISLPMGVLTLSELYSHNPSMQEEFQKTVTHVSELLEPFAQKNLIKDYIRAGRVQMIGVSGTVTTLGSIHRGLVRYNRRLVDGTYINRQDVFAITHELLDLDPDQRQTHPNIGSRRVDMLMPGLAIIEGIFNLLQVPRLRVADRGVREGILLDIMQKDLHLPKHYTDKFMQYR